MVRSAALIMNNIEFFLFFKCRFLPRLAASSLEKVLNDSEIQVNKESSDQQQVNVNNFVCEYIFLTLC